MLRKEVADANDEREFSRTLLGNKTKDADKMIELLIRDLQEKKRMYFLGVKILIKCWAKGKIVGHTHKESTFGQ